MRSSEIPHSCLNQASPTTVTDRAACSHHPRDPHCLCMHHYLPKSCALLWRAHLLQTVRTVFTESKPSTCACLGLGCLSVPPPSPAWSITSPAGDDVHLCVKWFVALPLSAKPPRWLSTSSFHHKRVLCSWRALFSTRRHLRAENHYRYPARPTYNLARHYPNSPAHALFHDLLRLVLLSVSNTSIRDGLEALGASSQQNDLYSLNMQ